MGYEPLSKKSLIDSIGLIGLIGSRKWFKSAHGLSGSSTVERVMRYTQTHLIILAKFVNIFLLTLPIKLNYRVISGQPGAGAKARFPPRADKRHGS
jgi:hypothetical protein